MSVLERQSNLPAALGELLAPRYRILDVQGRGGMAVVYLAEDRKHGRRVAIKVLLPEPAQALGAERFLREIRIAAGLNHTNIVPVFDSGEIAGTLYYVMPLVAGESLRTRLEREGPLPLADVVTIAAQVAAALDHAHGHGIVHRDLKPENVLLAEGHALVADFGVARASRDAGAAGLTEPGLAVGTPHYMSPEQAVADPRIDARSDQYALGVVVYEMLTGEPPFQSASPRAVLARKLSDDVPPIRTVRESVPSAVENVVMRALARMPADRYASAGEFAAALEKAAGDAASRPMPEGRSGRRNAGAAALLIALIVLAGWIWFSGPNDDALSIAVLPFQNRSGEQDPGFLVEGITEDITSELGRIAALRVTSRRTASGYDAEGRSAPEIARDLGVEALLEGSVTVDGDSMRLLLTLVHGPSDRQLWSESYRDRLENAVTLQRSAVLAVVEALDIEIGPAERVRLDLEHPVDAEAFRRYQVASNHLREGRPEQALDMYQRALAADSMYADAHAGAAMAWTQVGSWWGAFRPDSVYPLARRHAERALRLDPASAEGHMALATVLWLYDWEWESAEAEFRRGVNLVPGDPFSRIEFANFLTSMGRFEESIELGRKTLADHPALPAAYNELGWALDLGGYDEEAVAAYREGLMADTANVQTNAQLMIYFFRRQQADSALKYIRVMEERIDTYSPAVAAILAQAYASIGRLDDTRRIADRMLADRERMFVAPARMAIVHACLGEDEEALSTLSEAYEARDPSLVWYNVIVESCFSELRADPRFREIIRKMNFPRRG